MIKLLHSYRPPYDWDSFLKFLSLHLTKGTEIIKDASYYRTVRWEQQKGWLQVCHRPENNALEIILPLELIPVQVEILQQVACMFDLKHHPDRIAAHFQKCSILSQIVQHYPGLRVPGAFNGFELAMRAILGQQISVKAATTLAGRIACAFGEEIKTPFETLTHLTPTASTMAALKVEDLISLGVIKTRAHCIIKLAQEVVTTSLNLNIGADPQQTIQHLLTLPGIGDWTAHYIALRALKWDDAFLKSDLAIRQALGGTSVGQTERMSLNWRPWRSYANLYLWQKAIYASANKLATPKVRE